MDNTSNNNLDNSDLALASRKKKLQLSNTNVLIYNTIALAANIIDGSVLLQIVNY